MHGQSPAACFAAVAWSGRNHPMAMSIWLYEVNFAAKDLDIRDRWQEADDVTLQLREVLIVCHPSGSPG